MRIYNYIILKNADNLSYSASVEVSKKFMKSTEIIHNQSYFESSRLTSSFNQGFNDKRTDKKAFGQFERI